MPGATRGSTLDEFVFPVLGQSIQLHGSLQELRIVREAEK